jgi:GNAT superfamily N-acetyltransferase
MNTDKIVIRQFTDSDDIEELTQLLNLAYKKLSDKGFKFLASHQNSAKTKERIKNAECFLALLDDKIIGTITYHPPPDTYGNDWYDQETVATFGQFAVDPSFQKHGIGARLIELVEELAKEENVKELTIDTADGATDLINYYSKKGYRFVGHIKWDLTNYRSTMLSKKLRD